MRRPTAKRQQPGVALFPFLAVLICTMGALIVLLVLVVQGAQASAAAERAMAKAKSSLSAEELAARKQQAEDMQWQAEMLEKQRAEFAAKLQSKRLELSHLEEHLRRLEDESKQIQTEAEAMEQAGKDKLLDQEFAAQRLADIQKQLADKKRELEEAKKKNANKKPAYAIIPYEGPNGTSRRPIYIECREEGIVIQPEGVKFSPDDFEGPLGPGNPLDAALRAIREHQASQGLVGEPYPLIIVRPNGAVAFGACRAAMKHWENEFGYELVEQEAELKYPAADPRLADTLQRTLRDARIRQNALAAAMPNRFGTPGKMASFRAVDHSQDDAASDGSGGLGGGSGVGASGGIGTGGMAGRGVGSGMGGAGTGGIAGAGNNLGTGMGSGPGGPNAAGNRGMTGTGMYGQGPAGSGFSGPGQYAAGGPNANGGQPGNGGYGQQPNGSMAGGPYGSGGPGGSSAGSAAGGSSYGSPGSASNGSGSYSGGQPNSGNAGSYGQASGAAGGSAGASGNGLRSGNNAGGGAGGSQSAGGTGGPGGSAAGKSSSGGMASAGGSGMSGMSGSPSSSGASGGASSQGSQDSMGQQSQSMSPSLTMNKSNSQMSAKARKNIKNRGENWGLPDPTTRATPITRPIRVECHADKLVLVPERNEGRVPLVVPIDNDIASQLEVVLGSVWKYMDRWGLAMVNGYWKPILSVEVKPGGEDRFAELQAVLRGSGIEVERKK